MAIHAPSVTKSRSGFTLIELMIAMVLGLALMGGALQVFISSKKSFTFNEDLSWIQENARFSMEFITRDVRMAGYFGCGSSTLANTLNPSPSGTGWQYNFDEGIGGFDGDDSGFPSTEFPLPPTPDVTTGSLPKSDVFTVLRGDTEGQSYTVEKHTAPSAVIDLDPDPGFEKGRILTISDCDHAAIFQHTGNQANKANHNTGNSVSPGNCTKGLGLPVACGDPVGSSYKYEGDASVMEVLAHAYYVDEASNGIPTIYRQEITGGVDSDEEELVQGVENMQALFGEDTDGDSVANRYVTADNVTDWTAVISLRLHFLMRSLTEVTSNPQPFRFMGTTYTPEDNYLRKEFVSTVKIRNRGL